MTVHQAEAPTEFEKLILENVPKDVFMALDDAYRDGDEKGRTLGAAFAKGHQPTAVGMNKHLALQEAFHTVFTVHGGNPLPLKGNRVVTAQFGIVTLARLNVPGHKWVNWSRSKTRATLAEFNVAPERRFMQSDFFAQQPVDVSKVTLFVLGVMDGVDSNGLTQLTGVMIAAPAPDLSRWLYLKPLREVLGLYEIPAQLQQPDNVKPKLKKAHKKQSGDDQRDK